MEITSKFKERELLHHHHHHHQHQHQHQHQHHSSPLNSPNNNNPNNPNHNTLPITRSDPNSPYPTTFVTADTSSFKQVVQMLTGSSESTTPKTTQRNSTPNTPTSHPPAAEAASSHHQQAAALASASASASTAAAAISRNFVIPPIKTTQPKKQGFKLYERRNSIKHLISPLNASFSQTTSFSPRHKQDILSPSLLDFPSLTLSPVTPLLQDPFDKSSPSLISCCAPTTSTSAAATASAASSAEEEEKAIAEKGFYLHPSPISTPRDSEPQLLPLFPLSSPRVSEA